jgi:hypothetical protein
MSCGVGLIASTDMGRESGLPIGLGDACVSADMDELPEESKGATSALFSLEKSQIAPDNANTAPVAARYFVDFNTDPSSLERSRSDRPSA